MAKRPQPLTAWQRTKRRIGLLKYGLKRLVRRRTKPVQKARVEKPNLGLLGRASFEKWFNENDVARDAKGNLRVKVSKRLIGKGEYGKVYAGRIFFKDGTVKKIAVKIFHDDLTEELAEVYKQTIERLARANVPIKLVC